LFYYTFKLYRGTDTAVNPIDTKVLSSNDVSNYQYTKPADWSDERTWTLTCESDQNGTVLISTTFDVDVNEIIRWVSVPSDLSGDFDDTINIDVTSRVSGEGVIPHNYSYKLYRDTTLIDSLDDDGIMTDSSVTFQVMLDNDSNTEWKVTVESPDAVNGVIETIFNIIVQEILRWVIPPQNTTVEYSHPLTIDSTADISDGSQHVYTFDLYRGSEINPIDTKVLVGTSILPSTVYYSYTKDFTDYEDEVNWELRCKVEDTDISLINHVFNVDVTNSILLWEYQQGNMSITLGDDLDITSTASVTAIGEYEYTFNLYRNNILQDTQVLISSSDAVYNYNKQSGYDDDTNWSLTCDVDTPNVLQIENTFNISTSSELQWISEPVSGKSYPVGYNISVNAIAKTTAIGTWDYTFKLYRGFDTVPTDSIIVTTDVDAQYNFTKQSTLEDYSDWRLTCESTDPESYLIESTFNMSIYSEALDWVTTQDNIIVHYNDPITITSESEVVTNPEGKTYEYTFKLYKGINPVPFDEQIVNSATTASYSFTVSNVDFSYEDSWELTCESDAPGSSLITQDFSIDVQPILEWVVEPADVDVDTTQDLIVQSATQTTADGATHDYLFKLYKDSVVVDTKLVTVADYATYFYSKVAEVTDTGSWKLTCETEATYPSIIESEFDVVVVDAIVP